MTEIGHGIMANYELLASSCRSGTDISLVQLGLDIFQGDIAKSGQTNLGGRGYWCFRGSATWWTRVVRANSKAGR